MSLFTLIRDGNRICPEEEKTGIVPRITIKYEFSIKNTTDKYRSVKTDRVPGQLNVAFHWHILATENRRLPGCMVQVEGK